MRNLQETKGVRQGFTLISNHEFVDGNKHIGMYVMLALFAVNGIGIDCTNDDVIEAGLGVASCKVNYDDYPNPRNLLGTKY